MQFANNNKNAVHSPNKAESTHQTAKWESFWDLTDPETASMAMMELYGAAASRAASNCADAAVADGRSEDYRFWTMARSCIEASQLRKRQIAIAHWEANGLGLI